MTLEGVSLMEFFGANNSKFEMIKKSFPGLKIHSRGNKISLTGTEEQVELFERKVGLMIEFLRRYGQLSEGNIESLLEGIQIDHLEKPKNSEDDIIVHGSRGNAVKARTPNQKVMVQLSEENDVLFAIGPAGTGKTYTAVALAVRALKNKLVRRIILTRPAVEAGESLGFLPGDLKEKIDPYLRPLYDALDDLLPPDKLNLYMTNRIIEIAPLAYMRGRTLDNSFIILDEAQNATDLQMKMFLTRIGPSAKCIITGDMTQIDLPKKVKSGLPKSLRILKDIPGIGMIYLGQEDVIRHKLVKRIIKAYEHADRDEHLEKDPWENKRPYTNNPTVNNGPDPIAEP